MELDTFQLLVIGFVASVFAQVFKLIVAKLGSEVPRIWVTVAAFVISLVLAVVFMKPALPPAGDPNFVLALVQLATAVLGAATVIYNILLAKVFEKIGLSASAVLARVRGAG